MRLVLSSNYDAPIMMVLITRPIEEARTLAALLQQQKIHSMLCPLTQINPLPAPFDQSIAREHLQAVIATSANALKFLPALQAVSLSDLPFFAVGEATAKAAHQIGFTDVIQAGGDVVSLCESIKRACVESKGALLYLAGAQRRADLENRLDGFVVKCVELYEARAIAHLPKEVEAALAAKKIHVVCFFSERAARLFVAFARNYDVRQMQAVCLSRQVAACVRDLDFYAIKIADKTLQGMLALIVSASQEQ